jgi:hypothetical protein
MFGWRSAKCPLDTYEKTSTEWRMRWLAQQFGIERLLRAEVVLPNDEFFPEPVGESADDAQRLLERLCGYFGIDSRNIELEVAAEAQLTNAEAEGQQGQQRIVRIVDQYLPVPTQLHDTLSGSYK